jgi:chromosome segregation ATPase
MLNKKIDRAENTKAKEVDIMKEEITNLKSDIASYKTKLIDLTSDLNTLNNLLLNVRQENVHLSQTLNDKNTTCMELNRKIKQLDGLTKTYQTQIATANSTQFSLRDELKHERGENDRLHLQVGLEKEKFESSISEMELKILSLEKSLRESQNTIENKKFMCVQLEKEKHIAQEELIVYHIDVECSKRYYKSN